MLTPKSARRVSLSAPMLAGDDAASLVMHRYDSIEPSPSAARAVRDRASAGAHPMRALGVAVALLAACSALSSALSARAAVPS